VVGFSSLGWTSSGTAEQMAADRAEAAIVGVLTPIRKIYSVTIAKLRSVFGHPLATRASAVEAQIRLNIPV